MGEEFRRLMRVLSLALKLSMSLDNLATFLSVEPGADEGGSGV
jgi:hypothetical protein